MTYRERREARADRLRDWAGKREQKAEAAISSGSQRLDAIPFGQPVMGQRDANYRAKARTSIERGFEHAKKATEMSARADSIDAAAARAIYSDDTDGAEKMRERIAVLEAERDRIKAYNASCRKGAPDLELLDEKQRADLAMVARVQSWAIGKQGQFPGYALTNLSGNIARQKKRLPQLEAREQQLAQVHEVLDAERRAEQA